MGYDITSKKATIKYVREKQHEIKIRYRKDEFDQVILPAIRRSGMPTATYIKQAVTEKIKADSSGTYDLGSVLDSVKRITIESIPRILNDDCRQIILYGSCARGDYTNDSDVDIAILTDSDREQAKKYNDKINEIATRISLDTFAVVNYVCLPFDEYVDKKSWYPYFLNIAKDGVLLYER